MNRKQSQTTSGCLQLALRILSVLTICWSNACYCHAQTATEVGLSPDTANKMLEELATEYEDARASYLEAVRNASEESRRQTAIDLHPDDAFMPRFLELEERFRGTQSGFLTLRFILKRGRSFSIPNAISTRARFEAAKRLSSFYIDHEGADACLAWLDGGEKLPQTEEVFRKFAKSSPHAHVRAAAWFYLAQWLHETLALPELSRTALANIDLYPVEIRDYVKKKARSMQAFADIDVAQRRKQAANAAKQVLKEYVDHWHPKRQFTGPLQIFVETEDGVTLGESFGERAKHLLFEIENLSVGAVAPEITGRDAGGNRFKLSDYRGQVVVLMFSADWCGPCKAMYPELRQLQDRLKEDPFAIVGVMADEKVDTVRSAAETGDITWRVWWDGMKGPIATQRSLCSIKKV